jgi:hypothetical protein
MDELRQMNLKLCDPRGTREDEIRQMAADGKVFICQSMSLHADEIGGVQMAPELTYDLVSKTDGDTQRILDNVVFLLVPSFNPDGQIMVADWYQKSLGTEYEGTSLPWLYHKYTGHDNNRDAFMTNMVESRYMAKILFTDWKPEAYLDHHHMGSSGARIYVPPYSEPVRPMSDPLVWREMSWYGAHIAYKEQEQGLSGVINMSQFSGWGHFGFHWITPFHNIAGMLTESASAKLATPLYIHPSQLQGEGRDLPIYQMQTTFPDPWPGGWWRLRDIVDRQKVAAWALLDAAARNRETVLWNAYQKAKRQTERGAESRPAAYVIPAKQHDPLTMLKMINKLLIQGVEIQQAKAEFTIEDRIYPAGSYVVSLAQPKMGVISYLLGRTFYPDNDWTRNRDGSPIAPYDTAADVMAEFMGVRVDALGQAANADLAKVMDAVIPAGKVDEAGVAYLFDGRLNDSFKVMNLLLDKGVAVWRVDRAGQGLNQGDFIVGAGSETLLAEAAKQTGVDFKGLKTEVKQGIHEIKRLRIGMYQRYWGGNMDEGWTRWIFEQFGFPWATLKDAEVKAGKLNDKYDVLILPDDATGMIMGEKPQLWHGPVPAYPSEYRSGIGQQGVDALRAFVQKGGTLITLGGACDFAIEKLGVNVGNAAVDKNSKEFFCPGSTLRVKFDNTNPLAYGMPKEGLVLFSMSGSGENHGLPFDILPSDYNERFETIVTYADRDLLQSGWLIGEQVLAKKAGMVAAGYGQGRVILIGFLTQHRAQTHGTFKLLFNALIR